MRYRLKKILYLAAVLPGILFLPSSTIADVKVLSIEESGLSLAYRPYCSGINSITANGKTYSLYYYDSHSMNASSGAPMLPETTVFFAAPAGTVPAVEISSLSWSEHSGISIAPRPALEDDGYGFTIEIYSEDPLLYAISGYRPGSFWNLNEHMSDNGLTVWELKLRPLLFDAHASKAAIADSFDVRIAFGASPAEKTALPKRLPDHIINREIFIAPSESYRSRRTADEVFDPFARGDWYRVKVTQTGMYSISGLELSQTGFAIGSTSSDHIRMYYGGGKTLSENPGKIIPDGFKEIAIRINDGGDGVFNMNDTIVFYGSALSRFILEPENDRPVYQNHPYSTENVYWITISEEGTPKRIQTAGEIPSEAPDTSTTFTEFIHIERENHLDFEESGIQWYWEEISKSSKSFAFSAPGIVSGDSTVVKVMFLNQAITRVHNVDIYINDEGPFSFILSSSEFPFAIFSLYSTLKPSDNIIKIVRTNGYPEEAIRLDWLEIEYSKLLEHNRDTFDFFIPGNGSPVKSSIAHVEKPSVNLFDTTDPFRVSEINNTIYDDQAQTLTFQMTVPSDTRSRLTVSDPSSYLKVSSITKKKPLRPSLRNAGNGADYIIISHNKFLNEAGKLAVWRARDSQVDPLKSMAVDVENIYDEFAWGVFDPVSIRDFLKYAWDKYNPPVRYCCFLGDTIWKYKNLVENQKDKTLVPTMYHIDYHGCTATDDFYTWFDSTPYPYISTGRMCAYDAESAKTLVEKTIEYEQTPENGIWHNRVLFIADDETNIAGKGRETVYSYDTEAIDTGNYIPDSLERTKIMQIEYPMKNLRKPDATKDLIKAFNNGYLLMNYIGHGNKEVLAHEHILEGSRDIERLNNGPRQSVFFISSCSVAYFDLIDNISLAEMLHLRRDGGCLAVIAATRNTWNPLNVNLNKEFYLNLFDRDKNPDYRIGYALLNGKKMNYKDCNANRYVIMGDPATRLVIPRNTFAIADIDTVYRLQKLDLSGNITDGSGKIPYNGTLYIKAQGPKIHLIYTIKRGNKILYSMPGRTFYDGSIDISGEKFKTAIVIPKDLAPTGDDSKIFFFATGDNKEATGILEKFSIGGLYPDAPEDATGPEIKLSFDGKSFEDGDYIRRQPTLSLIITDPSGINIYGNRGHNITLMIDNIEIVILTVRLKYINGHTTGTLDYTLPVLSPGEHTFELSVYDSCNNLSKKHFSAIVTGSETGDIFIENLLNYPNPMNSDGTTFTFSLNDDAGNAKIKIYSQAGRLVDTISFSASFGYNTVFWKPTFGLANGVYFYKLTVWSFNGRKSSKTEKLVVMR